MKHLNQKLVSVNGFWTFDPIDRCNLSLVQLCHVRDKLQWPIVGILYSKTTTNPKTNILSWLHFCLVFLGIYVQSWLNVMSQQMKIYLKVSSCISLSLIVWRCLGVLLTKTVYSSKLYGKQSKSICMVEKEWKASRLQWRHRIHKSR